VWEGVGTMLCAQVGVVPLVPLEQYRLVCCALLHRHSLPSRCVLRASWDGEAKLVTQIAQLCTPEGKWGRGDWGKIEC
jgi:hypothetical protein